jgi:hypothetical protein
MLHRFVNPLVVTVLDLLKPNKAVPLTKIKKVNLELDIVMMQDARSFMI